MTGAYLAADHAQWRHPNEEHPPLGTKLLILTRGGVCVIGHWNREEGAVAWSPLPKLLPELRARLEAEGFMV